MVIIDYELDIGVRSYDTMLHVLACQYFDGLSNWADVLMIVLVPMCYVSVSDIDA
jgi:phosphatidate phosphatase APP1